MMLQQSLYHTYKRYTSLKTDNITALPIVIIMPHSACNCRCIMCDIWKGNKNVKQLAEDDIEGLSYSLKKLEVKNVVMSGGEALLNQNFFTFCRLLKKQNVKITLLSTGLLLKKYAEEILRNISEIIVSLDGDEQTHDAIRNIKGAYRKLKEGVQYLKYLNPDFKISARCVIHKWNFRNWSAIIESAKELSVDSISFLPADISSEAFNRSIVWNSARQQQVAISIDELPELDEIIASLFQVHKDDFETKFIVESEQKILQIGMYYKAIHGLTDYPFKKCNAPWVSTVIDAEGNVQPCFFHPSYGNIRNNSLEQIINLERAKAFRSDLKKNGNDICKRCVCSLHLSYTKNPVARL